MFVERGYAAATIPEVARAAGVAVDTVYAAVGRKPVLFRLLIETALSGEDHPVQAERRDYVRRIRQADTAGEKIAIYAAAIRPIQERIAPLFVALRDASGQERRAGRALAGDHRAAGGQHAAVRAGPRGDRRASRRPHAR